MRRKGKDPSRWFSLGGRLPRLLGEKKSGEVEGGRRGKFKRPSRQLTNVACYNVTLVDMERGHSRGTQKETPLSRRFLLVFLSLTLRGQKPRRGNLRA